MKSQFDIYVFTYLTDELTSVYKELYQLVVNVALKIVTNKKIMETPCIFFFIFYFIFFSDRKPYLILTSVYQISIYLKICE